MTHKIHEPPEDIGKIAGMVWEYLHKKKYANAAEIREHLSIKNSLLFMAFGWLARENKVEISKDGAVYCFKLIDK